MPRTPPPYKRSRHPALLFYACEHADEHDGSWVAQGVIEFLLSNNPKARAIRNRFTVLVIPLLDPDGAAANVYNRITLKFHSSKIPVSHAYGTFFESWVRANNRLDVVLNLHNVESDALPHLACALMEPRSHRYRACHALHAAIVHGVAAAGYSVRAEPTQLGWMTSRLGGWLRCYFGPAHLLYEVNSQAPGRHLSLYELKALGPRMLIAAAKHLYSSGGRSLVRSINRRRAERAKLIKRYGELSYVTDRNAHGYEQMLHMLPNIERMMLRKKAIPDWLAPLHPHHLTYSQLRQRSASGGARR